MASKYTSKPKKKTPSGLIPPKPIISIKEARKLLGKEAETLSDDEIKAMLTDLEILARQAVREYLVRK